MAWRTLRQTQRKRKRVYNGCRRNCGPRGAVAAHLRAAAVREALSSTHESMSSRTIRPDRPKADKACMHGMTRSAGPACHSASLLEQVGAGGMGRQHMQSPAVLRDLVVNIESLGETLVCMPVRHDESKQTHESVVCTFTVWTHTTNIQ